MAWFISLAVVIIGVGLHLGFTKRPRTAALVVEVILLYLLVVFAGVGGLVGALGHTFMAQEVALKIGWTPGSPFQFEVAMANLAFGVLGILCWRWRDGFWTATGLGLSIYLLGCAYGHLREMLAAGNFSPYNAGAVLWLSDIAIPLLLLGLLWARHRLTLPKETG